MEIEAILQRLDRLMQDEAWMTVPETLTVIYSLIQNTRMFMGGEQTHWYTCYPQFVEHFPPQGNKASICSVLESLDTFFW